MASKTFFVHSLGTMQRSVLACGDVAEDCAVAQQNVLEAKAGDRCFVSSDFF